MLCLLTSEDTATESNSVINGEKRPAISQHIDSRFQQIMSNLSTTATGWYGCFYNIYFNYCEQDRHWLGIYRLSNV